MEVFSKCDVRGCGRRVCAASSRLKASRGTKGMGFTVVVHHGGAFVKGRTVRYEGGEVHAIHNIDIDSWSYFEALGLVKDLGYREKVNLWWNVAKGRMNRTFRSISWDSHALEMGNYALLHNCEVDLYVEHTQIAEPILLEDSTLLTYKEDGDKENVEADGIGGEGDSKFDEGDVEQGDDVNVNSKGGGDVDVNDFESDDGINDMHFSDSEEERDLGMDDGFEDNNDEQNVVKERKLKSKTTPLKNPILSPEKGLGKRHQREQGWKNIHIQIEDISWQTHLWPSCQLPPKEPEGEGDTSNQPAATNKNSQTKDKGKEIAQGSTSGTTTASKKKAQPKDKRKQKAQGTTSGTTAGNKKAAATRTTVGNKKAAGTTAAATGVKKTAAQSQDPAKVRGKVQKGTNCSYWAKYGRE
ncbi:hypothetical protein SESBI_19963 [Sesbania bispinosa]|nr:hypothetical protein SESBI_19963 [Sesbania bispinosa]